MSQLTILEFPDPRLRTVAEAITVFDGQLSQLVTDMQETMYHAQGIGLAATQVDIHQRLLVMDVSPDQNDFQVFINPEIIDREGGQTHEEGCLSVPGTYAKVVRAEHITVRAQDTEGKTFEKQLDGLAAVCIQHEMDHLEGKLFIDYLSPLKRAMVKKKLEKQRRQELSESPSTQS